MVPTAGSRGGCPAAERRPRPPRGLHLPAPGPCLSPAAPAARGAPRGGAPQGCSPPGMQPARSRVPGTPLTCRRPLAVPPRPRCPPCRSRCCVALCPTPARPRQPRPGGAAPPAAPPPPAPRPGTALPGLGPARDTAGTAARCSPPRLPRAPAPRVPRPPGSDRLFPVCNRIPTPGCIGIRKMLDARGTAV